MNNELEVKLEEIFEDHFNNDYIRQIAFKKPIFDSVEMIGIQLTSLLSKDNIKKLVNYFYPTIYEKLYTYLATDDITQFKYELIKTG